MENVFIFCMLCIFFAIFAYFILYTNKHNSIESFNAVQKTWTHETDLIVVTSHYNEDLNWLKKLPYPVVVCSKEGAAIPAIPADPACIIPNVGREASSYLKFIITYYDVLPKHIAFLHGHETAWHQSVNIVDALRCAKYKEYGYVSLNGTFFLRSDDSEFHTLIQRLWKQHFKQHTGTGIDYPKNSVLHDSCAQFIVSREKIRVHKKETYQYWLDIMSSITLPRLTSGQFSTEKFDSSFLWALVFEFVWHMIFGEPARIDDAYEDYMITHFTCFPNEKRSLIIDNGGI
jgi:hypothetical protein